MSKVYTVNDGKSKAEQIPSVEYINEILKMIEEQLLYKNEFHGFQSIKTTTEELPVGLKEQPAILAKDIGLDCNHKFVNDALLNTLIDKPTKFEVERNIEESKEELKKYMEKLYIRIVNTPNVINKLRDISTVLSDDTIASGLLNTLANKVNFEDFEAHGESSIHMNNNDRKALNILIKCLANGFSDWNAKDDACNAIKNKPESLPANGGNADTVANHSIEDIINKDDYDLVIGSSLEKYSKDSCDIYAENGFLNNNDIIVGGSSSITLFKRGYYNFDTFIGAYKVPMIYKGADCRLSLIHADEHIIFDNVVFSNIGFYKSKIFIKSNCEFKNVKFANCEITLYGSEACTITDCVFEKCDIVIEDIITNNIIKFNRFIQTKPIIYIGGSNIISDNIY